VGNTCSTIGICSEYERLASKANCNCVYFITMESFSFYVVCFCSQSRKFIDDGDYIVISIKSSFVHTHARYKSNVVHTHTRYKGNVVHTHTTVEYCRPYTY
jgi:hypothetical protein